MQKRGERRFWMWLGQRLRSPACLVLGLWLTARLIGLALGWLLWQLGLVPPDPATPPQVYLDVGPVAGWALGVWQRLDTPSYLSIAAQGYRADNGSVVFAPLYPLLIRLVGTALGGQFLLAALLISSVACVGLLALLYQITAREFDAGSARRAVVYQIFFPAAYVLIAAYAEPLMLCLILLAFLWARRGRWGLAGTAACLATLTRFQAVVVVLPLTYIYLRRFGLTRRAWHPEVLALVAAPAALLGYHVYLAWPGLPSVETGLAQQWYAMLALPGTNLLNALRALLAGGMTLPRALSLGLTILFLVLTGVAFRRLSPEYGLYMAAILLYTLSRYEPGGRALLSVSRPVLAAFPGFMLLGAAGRRRWLHRLILYSSLALYLFLMGIFFLGGYAG